ncbi:Methyltransferase domain-containing protein [Paenibacillus sp. 1_12]|uniref:class I SAM-dependent methyltransferase n=1 Tax=Paenibacillus sp. 1_12 TaxID=1566278 RepID=UPI0008E1E199|nr:class I SAM-dependent methyltransferase [Paenibacillus sp. 1_12]SFL80698.1 Methyltransferase domain-containing protein [Paenibacillus sp. 1_12]
MELNSIGMDKGIEHQIHRSNHPILIKLLETVYWMYFIVLYPIYYVWNKRDFTKNKLKNPFYISKLVRLIEKHPRLYEWSMFVLNFPKPTSVYRFLPPLKGSILQVGCGTGLLNKHVGKSQSKKIVNLDINPHYLEYGIRKGRYDSYLLSGIYDVPMEDKSFDVIIFARCFHHIRHHKKAFAECARLLKDHGEIWIADPVIMEEAESGKQMTEGYMVNSSIDGVIWRFTKAALIKHIIKSLPPQLQLTSITDDRQLHMTNYNLKYAQTDILAVIVKTSDSAVVHKP